VFIGLFSIKKYSLNIPLLLEKLLFLMFYYNYRGIFIINRPKGVKKKKTLGKHLCDLFFQINISVFCGQQSLGIRLRPDQYNSGDSKLQNQSKQLSENAGFAM